MRLKVNKAALSVATAVLMLTSMFSVFSTSAAAVNEITLSSDRNTYIEGERIDVSVALEPDDIGAAGFTLNLHYDPELVEVHIPTAAEAATKYNVGSSFSVITNYSHSEGEVRLVGANLTGGNITAPTKLGLASFDVKKGTQGSIDFWVEVETLVYAAENGFANAKYTAPALSFKKYVETTVTTTTTSVTTTAPVVTTVPEEITTTTVPEETLPPETSEEITEPSEPETVTAAVTEAPVTSAETEASEPVTTAEETVTTTEPVTTTTAASVTEPPAETTEEQAGIVIEPEATEPSEQGTPADAVFAYTQRGGDFNSETDVYYVIPVKDYVDDINSLYDLRISVQASGNANGGIGMMVGGQWEQAAEKLRSPEEKIWIVRNIEPAKLNSDIVVALFYLKDNAEFRINGIEFEKVEAAADSPAPAEGPVTEPVNIDAPAEEQQEGTVKEDPAPAEGQEAEEKPEEQAAPTEEAEEPQRENVIAAEETPSENNEGTGVKAVIGEEQPEAPIKNPSETINEQGAEGGSSPTSTADEVEKAVVRAQEEAGIPDAPGSNPQTGEGRTLKNIIMMISGGVILWSVFAMIFNAVSAGREKKN